MKNENTVGRVRLQAFFDQGTFVELGAYINRPGTEDAEGVICGYGAKEGRLVFAFSQDATLMKGALDLGHARKIADLYQKAVTVGAPVVGFFDCAGAVVFDGAAALSAYGQLLATVSGASGVIPQIAVVCGVCAGSMAAVAALFDVTVALKDAKLYVSSPTLTGGEVGSADYAAANGNAALVVTDEKRAMSMVAEILKYLPDRVGGNLPVGVGDDLNRPLADVAPATAKAALESAVDMCSYTPLYTAWGEEVTAGLAFMGNMPAAVLATDGALTAKGLSKIVRLLKLADRLGLPTVTFVNSTGIAPDAETEPELPVLLAEITALLQKSATPHVGVVVGAAVGAGFLLGASRTVGADMVYALPGTEIAVLTASAGVAFLWNDRITPEVTRGELEAKWRAEVAAPEMAAAQGEIDDIISPRELRARVLAALMMLRDKGKRPCSR